MSTIRKAVAQFLTAIGGWATAVVVSPGGSISAAEWVVLATAGIGAFLVWLVPNGPQQVEIVGEPVVVADAERGAVDSGSLALGILLGVAMVWAVALIATHS
jgi:hypothetical protein